MADTTATGTAGSALPAAGGTSTQGLADWAAPYITNYLGQAQALSDMPYQVYQGPLTAGPSALQTQAFQGIGSLTVPSQFATATSMAQQAGQAPGTYNPTTFANQFQAPGAYQTGDFSGVGFNAPGAYNAVGSSFTAPGVAQQYMNPYLNATLQPQLNELQRQSTLNLNPQLAKFTQAGAYGGSREAILRSEAQRNLLDQVDQTSGRLYNSAYDQAQQQFNTEQQRKIQEAQFGAQQGMTAAELAARYGLDVARAVEQSRQFGAQQGMTAAELAARYGSDAARATEQSRQFGASYGLDALKQKLSAAQTLGTLGQYQQQSQNQNFDQMLRAGLMQRDIEQQGITADLNEFNAQREYPYKQVQFQRDMISGLPINSVTNTPAQLSGIAQIIAALGGGDKLLSDSGIGGIADLLSKLGLNLSGTEAV